MEIKAVCAAFFSATGTTKKIVWEIAKEIAFELKISLREFDFTLPQARRNPPVFSENEIVVFGTPVYAGRVPNVLLPYLAAIEGHGAAAVPVVVYGNRDFDDALIELRDILLKGGLKPIAAAAFVGEHSFSDRLAKGRPDAEDLRLARGFAEQAVQKLRDNRQAEELFVKGVPQPYRGYYQPRDRKGNPVEIRKVKPLTGDVYKRQLLGYKPGEGCDGGLPVPKAKRCEYRGDKAADCRKHTVFNVHQVPICRASGKPSVDSRPYP